MIKRIPELLARGCDISVNRGVLIVSHPTDPHYSDKWLKKYTDHIFCELSVLISMPIFQYTGYSTGDFGKKDANGHYPKGRQSGVCLQFVEVTTGESYRAIFNANLRRARTTKSGKAGGCLPKGRFTVKKQSSFVKFWRNTELAFSCYSEFHKRMGKLSKFFFISLTNEEKKKLVNKTICPLSLTTEDIHRYLGDNKAVMLRQKSDNAEVRVSDSNLRQAEAINSCDKENAAAPNPIHLKAYSEHEVNLERKEDTTYQIHTMRSHYELSNKGITCKESLPSSLKGKLPQEQTTEEWLADYDKAG